MDKQKIIALLEAASDKAAKEYAEDKLNERSVAELAEKIAKLYCHILETHIISEAEEVKKLLTDLSQYVGAKPEDLIVCDRCGTLMDKKSKHELKFQRKTFTVCESCQEIPVSEITGNPLVYIENGKLKNKATIGGNLLKEGKIKGIKFELELAEPDKVELLKEKLQVTSISRCDKCSAYIFYNDDDIEFDSSCKCSSCNTTLGGKFENNRKNVTTSILGDESKSVILPFDRTFGIELESKEALKANKLIAKVAFNPVGDGSISGLEYVSEVLQGDEGLAEIKHFLRSINGKAPTYSQAGYHLHMGIDESEINIYSIKKILATYSLFEDLLFAMQPPSRRGNHYCQNISELFKNKFKEIGTIERFLEKRITLDEFMSKLYNGRPSERSSKYHDTRYIWVNLHSVFYRGTLEIRNHSATFNYKKIKNWILINQAILNKALGMSLPEVKELYYNTPNNLSSKLEVLYSLFPDTKPYLAVKEYIEERLKRFNVNTELPEEEEYETDFEVV